MNKCSEALMTTIPADQCSFVFVHPCEQAFDLPSTSVASEWGSILGGWAHAVPSMRGNQFDSLDSQLPIERVTVVGTIPHKHGSNFFSTLKHRDFELKRCQLLLKHKN